MRYFIYTASIGQPLDDVVITYVREGLLTFLAGFVSPTEHYYRSMMDTIQDYEQKNASLRAG